MLQKYIANTLEELPVIAKDILSMHNKERIFILEGDMGAGKTTITKALCRQLGTTDNVCSPTFSIVNHYLSKEMGDIYHFDFYRINNEQEAFDIGFEEYIYSGSYCFIEWAERVINLLPSHYTIISIKEIEKDKREITIKINNSF